MMRTKAQHRTAIWRPLMLLPLILLVAVLGSGLASSEVQSPRLHAAVLDWAETHPGEAVPVIIQMKEPDRQVAEAIERSGGVLTRDLRIIGGFSALVPADALEGLASHQQVRWISLDAPVMSTATIDTSKLATAYPFSVSAPAVWNATTSRTGRGVTVAVLDTGVFCCNEDFKDTQGNKRIVFDVVVNPQTSNVTDGYGHGTHVAGIIGGDGDFLAGKYIGIAPDVNLINVKISDDSGVATVGDVINGLQWVVENKDQYNIRVVNLSLRSTVAQSYTTDPLDAAVELAWFKGIVVVTSAGNLGANSDAVSYAPANDPFILVVGAVDDMGTGNQADDRLTSWSSRGTTQDGFYKPDVVAPGRSIVSNIDSNSYLYQSYPGNVVHQDYFRLSGTSMSAAVVSGVTALMLEQHPEWTPGEVKYVLRETARSLPGDKNSREPLADRAVFYTRAPGNTNDGLIPNTLLLQAAGVTDLQSITWGSITWGSITWGSITWGSITWGSITWGSITWDTILTD